ncbi:MAG: heparan N-sulfatase [Verrucomicrobia bacterium]|nr:MAG: heparan N-sulfatase [Verrucomicrobiota bacterium]
MKRRNFLKLAGCGAVGAAVFPRLGKSADAIFQGLENKSAARPNILFALADDWGFGHAGVYGCQWVKTPNFDRVAREGILFTHAYTPTAKCAPSRAALLTGRNPWQLKAAANHYCYFPPEFKTYAEALTGLGYFVGMTEKGWAPGSCLDATGKKREMAGQRFQKRKAPPPTACISANDYAANFADFLDAAPTGQPWCFWYGSIEPHRDYEYGSGVAKGGKKTTEIERVPACWPDNETVRKDLLDYAFEVEHFDRHLGRMLADLEKRGWLENTLVIVTGDNGMPFPHDKGHTYQDSNHLPLAAMWKRGIRRPGRVVEDYVSFIDFAPTFVELARLRWEQTGMAAPTGRSLTDIFFADKAGQVNPVRDHVIIGRERNDTGRPHDESYPVRGIVKDNLLYLHNFEPTRWPCCNPETGYLDTDSSPTKTEVLKTRTVPEQKHFWDACFGKRPQEELYDLVQDRDCVNNLAGRPEFQERMAQLKQQLFVELKAQEDPRVLGQGQVFDEYPNSGKEWRGFYERYQKDKNITTGGFLPSDFEKAPLD